MPRQLLSGIMLALAVLLAGCTTKKRVVDANFTIPEGVASSDLELITYFDGPAFKIRMVDKGQIGQVDIGPDTAITDQIARNPLTGQLEISSLRRETPGTVRGFVFNRTGAEGIEVFRTDPNGAVRRLFEFALPVTRRWIDGSSEYYEFTDSDPQRPANCTYYVRGLIGGVAGASSPISNPSRPLGAPLTEIRYAAERFGTPTGGRHFDAESTFFMAWTPVSGASRYYIHVFQYQPTATSLENRILSGAPSPVMTIDARDIFCASLPATSTTYKMGASGATIYTFRAPRRLADHYVRISAVDANGEMIGMTTGPSIAQSSDLRFVYRFGFLATVTDHFVDFTAPEIAGASPPAYLLYSRGAVWVGPGVNPNQTTATSASNFRGEVTR